MIALIAFLGYGVQYIQRINMSVAIVCMVNNTALDALKAANAPTVTEQLPEADTVQCQFETANSNAAKLVINLSLIVNKIFDLDQIN